MTLILWRRFDFRFDGPTMTGTGATWTFHMIFVLSMFMFRPNCWETTSRSLSMVFTSSKDSAKTTILSANRKNVENVLQCVREQFRRNDVSLPHASLQLDWFCAVFLESDEHGGVSIQTPKQKPIQNPACLGGWKSSSLHSRWFVMTLKNSSYT